MLVLPYGKKVEHIVEKVETAALSQLAASSKQVVVVASAMSVTRTLCFCDDDRRPVPFSAKKVKQEVK